LEQTLRLEDYGIFESHFSIGVNLERLPLVLRIDEEVLTCVSHRKWVLKYDLIRVQLRSIVIDDQIIKYLVP
jgi:hypothetical protein